MTALVQTYQQQTMSLPYHRSSSSKPTQFSPPPSGHPPAHIQRQLPSNLGPLPNHQGYRGSPSLNPVNPYAFTSPPSLITASNNETVPFLRRDQRSLSAPLLKDNAVRPPTQTLHSPRHHHQPNASASSSSTISSKETPVLTQQYYLYDPIGDSAKLPTFNGRKSVQPGVPDQVSGADLSTALGSSERFNRRSTAFDKPAHGGSAHTENAAQTLLGQNTSPTSLSSFAPFGTNVLNLGAGIHTPQTLALLPGPSSRHATTTDDMPMYRRPALVDPSTRDRRRSISSLDVRSHAGPNAFPPQPRASGGQMRMSNSPANLPAARQIPFMSTRVEAVQNTNPAQNTGRKSPANVHSRHGSNESSGSRRVVSPKPSSLSRDDSPSRASIRTAQPIERQEPKLINVPPRGSSDAMKKGINPSPLSRTAEPVRQASNVSPPEPKSVPEPQSVSKSPAVQKLAELEDKDKKKAGKSRLRRAFSFGSAAELRRVTAENNMSKENTPPPARLTKDRPVNDDLENDPISKRQEAGGLGKGIYSGQGNFFTGSTDNLSISSTASSASMMMRKMGRGVKKGSRSLVGLFRPKSVIGVPPMSSGHGGAGVGEVSIVNVEAEREKVNVNINPHDHAGGGTGFPKLERNSIEAPMKPMDTRVRGSLSSDTNRSRRSFVGADGERAEVLAAMKKGILKRTATGASSGQSSPALRPADGPSSVGQTPFGPPAMDTPRSSQPSTPGDERPAHFGHKRTESVAMEDDNYFVNLPRLLQTEEGAITPSAFSPSRFNVKFSPRIEFHDTWPSLEYDRRGEIATCNKLTPMLAAQIKEELNTFKMEMEVHEHSKVYTHFF